MDLPETLELPIFPLGVVLFPGMPLPLHIFEERYRAMIQRCLEERQGFGVVLLRDGQAEQPGGIPYEIGTVARIVRHVRLDDGRYNILTRGLRRFQILASRLDAAGYLTAQVALLEEDEQDRRHLATLHAMLEDECDAFVQDLVALTNSRIEPPPFPAAPTTASYHVAHYLPIYTWEKQRLLEATSTDLRLAEELRIVRRERGMLREFGVAPAIFQIEDGQGPRVLQN